MADEKEKLDALAGGLGAAGEALGTIFAPGLTAAVKGFNLFTSGPQDMSDEVAKKAAESLREDKRAKKLINARVPLKVDSPFARAREQGPLPPPAIGVPYRDQIVPYREVQTPDPVEALQDTARYALDPIATELNVVLSGVGLLVETGAKFGVMPPLHDITHDRPGALVGGDGGDLGRTRSSNWVNITKASRIMAQEKNIGDMSFAEVVLERVPSFAQAYWATQGETRFVTSIDRRNWFDALFPTRTNVKVSKPIPDNLAVAVDGGEQDVKSFGWDTKGVLEPERAPFYARRRFVQDEVIGHRDRLRKKILAAYIRVQGGQLSWLTVAEKLEGELLGLNRDKRYGDLFFTREEEALAEVFANTSPSGQSQWLLKNKKFLDSVMPYGVVPREGQTAKQAIASGEFDKIRIAVLKWTSKQWMDDQNRWIEDQKKNRVVPFGPSGVGEGLASANIAYQKARKMRSESGLGRRGAAGLWAVNPLSDIDEGVARERIGKGQVISLHELRPLVESYRTRLREALTEENLKHRVQLIDQDVHPPTSIERLDRLRAIKNQDWKKRYIGRGLHTELGQPLQSVTGNPDSLVPSWWQRKVHPFLVTQAINEISDDVWREMKQHQGEWKVNAELELSGVDAKQMFDRRLGLRIKPMGQSFWGESGTRSHAEVAEEAIGNAYDWVVGKVGPQVTWADIPFTDGQYEYPDDISFKGGIVAARKKLIQSFLNATYDGLLAPLGHEKKKGFDVRMPPDTTNMLPMNAVRAMEEWRDHITSGTKPMGAPEVVNIPFETLQKDFRDSRSNAVINLLRPDTPASEWHYTWGLRWNDKARWEPRLHWSERDKKWHGGWKGGWWAANDSTSERYTTVDGKSIPVMPGKYDGMSYYELASHAAENMPIELVGIAMFFPMVLDGIYEGLAEPFSGRTAVESAEALEKNALMLSEGLVHSLATHMGDYRAGIVEEGAITQLLWYAPLMKLSAAGMRGLLKNRLYDLGKAATKGKDLRVSVSELVVDEGTAAQMEAWQKSVDASLRDKRGKLPDPPDFEVKLKTKSPGERSLGELAIEEVAGLEATYAEVALEASAQRRAVATRQAHKRKQALRRQENITRKAQGKEPLPESPDLVSKNPAAKRANEIIRNLKGKGPTPSGNLAFREALVAEETAAVGLELATQRMSSHAAHKVFNPALSGLERNLGVFLERLPTWAGMLTAPWLAGSFAANPLGALGVLGRLVSFAITAEGAGKLRWWLEQPDDIVATHLRRYTVEQAKVYNKNELLRTELVRDIPKLYRKTVQDVFYETGSSAVTRADVLDGSAAKKALDAARLRQMERVLNPKSEFVATRDAPAGTVVTKRGVTKTAVSLRSLINEGRLYKYYEDSIPAVIWDEQLALGVDRIGGWKVNPVLKGGVSKRLEGQFEANAYVMNKHARNLSVHALDLNHQARSFRFWNPIANNGKGAFWTGMFENTNALNKFWWPKQFRAWGKVSRFFNDLSLKWRHWGDAKALQKARSAVRSMRADLTEAAVSVERGSLSGAGTSKLRTSVLAERGYPISAQKNLGLNQNLIAQTVQGLGEFDFAFRQFKIYQQIARDPVSTYHGGWRPGAGAAPLHPPGAQKIMTMDGGAAFSRRGKWIQLPKDPLVAGGSVPKWGELAGRWIDEDLFLHLYYAEDFAQYASSSKWAAGVGFFKTNYTVWNAPTLMRNLYTNVLLFAPMNGMMMIGPNMKFYKKAMEQMAEGGALYRLAHQNMVFDGTFARTELSRSATTASLRGIFGRAKISAAELAEIQNSLRTGNIGRLNDAQRLFLQETPGALYSAMDDLFRFAHWLKLTDMGTKRNLFGEMALHVRRSWIDYENAAGFVQVLRAPTGGWRNILYALAGAPFMSFGALSVSKSGPIRTFFRNKPIRAQIMTNTWENYSNNHFSVALSQDPEATRGWMKSMRLREPFWRRLRYIPASSTGIIGRMIEWRQGSPNLRVRKIPREVSITTPSDQHPELKDGTEIIAADGRRHPVKTLDEAIRKATDSLESLEVSAGEKLIKVSGMVMDATGVQLDFDDELKMWTYEKVETKVDHIPDYVRMFNAGYYTPIDWLIPQLEAYSQDNMIEEFASRVAVGSTPIVGTMVAWWTGQEAYFGSEIYKYKVSEEDRPFTQVKNKAMAYLKYGLANMIPPWIMGTSRRKLEAAEKGRVDYRGRLRNYTEALDDAFWGVRYEEGMELPESISRTVAAFKDDMGAAELKIQKETMSRFAEKADNEGIEWSGAFDYDTLWGIAFGDKVHVPISNEKVGMPQKMAKAILREYMQQMNKKGLAALRELQRAIGDVPSPFIPDKYKTPKVDRTKKGIGGAIPTKRRDFYHDGNLSFGIDSFKELFNRLPIGEFEALNNRNVDYNEEEFLAFVQTNPDILSEEQWARILEGAKPEVVEVRNKNYEYHKKILQDRDAYDVDKHGKHVPKKEKWYKMIKVLAREG